MRITEPSSRQQDGNPRIASSRCRPPLPDRPKHAHDVPRSMGVLLMVMALVAPSVAGAGAVSDAELSAGGIDLLLADDFESATLCAWSSSVPPSSSTWHFDADADTYGDPAVSTESCAAPPKHVGNADDCDDGSAATFPGAAPLDSPFACLLDDDADDFGADSPPIGVGAGSDCDDGAAAVNTAATEICNAIDDDCDTDIDEGFDLDGDTFASCGGDCNDADPDIHPGAFDDPDTLFIDDNCDGIDGDVARAAFVAPSGVDGTGCTLAAPCLSIGHGASVAAADPQRDQVFVQAGSYDEILVVPTGIAIVGGYDILWQRAARTVPGHTATIVGGYSAAADAWVTVQALSVTASFADLVLAGPAAASTGDSSIVVHSKLSTLQLARVTFQQGDGADGAAGAAGIDADPFPAPSGVDGLDGQEEAVVCSNFRRPGGGAGVHFCDGSNRSGAAGGAGGGMDTNCSGPNGTCSSSGCNASVGLSGGTSPSGALGGDGGAGGGTCASTAAVEGTRGLLHDGLAGTGQNSRGFLEGLNQWRGRSGTAGGLGSHGGGGGGGGGAGGCDTGFPEDRGPSGGGGGAGGCRASSAGGGGGAGGGSFGIVAIQSTVVVTASLFIRGSGGGGGAGGAGAAGQPGGDGGLGGNAGPDTGPAGPGGVGARGGHSGGGGGGAGGLSYGLFSFESAVTSTGNSVVGGSSGPGGAGGLSPGDNDGGNGFPGSGGTIFTCASAAIC